MAKEHFLITRLKKLRSVYNAIFSRTATTKHVLPAMGTSVANIIKDAQVIQAGLLHIQESYFDDQQLSDEFAHLVTFAINLPATLEGDGSFWGYALNMVDLKTFKEGAEYCNIEELQAFSKVLEEIIAIKISIRKDKDT